MQFERRAIFFPGTRECDWQTSTPETSADKVLLKARLSGISAGTEGMWFDGSASALKSGRKSYPYFPGYEFVGEVVSVGADVTADPGRFPRLSKLGPGDRVFAFKPHAGANEITEADMWVRLDASVDDADALALALCTTGIHAVHRGAPTAGSSAAVFGLGTMGLTLIQTLAAIGSGAEWELFQFRDATVLEPGVWRLGGLWRGQFGTEPLMPDSWAPGALVVLLNGAPRQLDLPDSAQGVARRWRIGPAALAYDDPVYVESTEAFAGNGLRPYAPVFLRAERDGAGDLALSWIRRTRLGGDSWDAPDVPLSEESEGYLLRVSQSGSVVREVTLGAPAYVYTAADQAADSVSGPFVVSIAQVSARYGAGLFAAIPVPG